MKKKFIMSGLLVATMVFSSATALAASTALSFSFYGASDRAPIMTQQSFTMNGSQTGKLNINAKWNYWKGESKGSCANLHVNYIKGSATIKTTTLTAVPRGSKYKAYSVSTSKLPKGTYKLQFKAACTNSVFDAYGTIVRWL